LWGGGGHTEKSKLKKNDIRSGIKGIGRTCEKQSLANLFFFNVKFFTYPKKKEEKKYIYIPVRTKQIAFPIDLSPGPDLLERSHLS
jgi:hypothetical protein